MPLSTKKLRVRREPIFVGIDPGAGGGIVAITPDGLVVGTPMPDTELDIWELMSALVVTRSPIVGLIEKVWAAPTQGRKQGGSSMFSFGKSFGQLRMALTVATLESGGAWEDVTPQVWQRGMGFPARAGEGPKPRKERLRAFAQRLFPRLELWKEPKSRGRQLAVADALVIAEYCRRRHRGSI